MTRREPLRGRPLLPRATRRNTHAPNSERRRGRTFICGSVHLSQARILGDTSLPTLRWGKQSTWLAASGSRHICGRSPHPLCASAVGVLKHEVGRQENASVTAVWALCASFGVEVEAVPLSRVFGQRWAACGAEAVRTIQIQRKNTSGEPGFGPSGGVRFLY